MWRRGKRKTERMRRRLGAFLDEGSDFEGNYVCSGTVMLEAKFRGDIRSEDTLIVGERAVVHANVQTSTLVVHGELFGNITASERIELKRTARVTGDIEAPVIVMEEGAVHDGHCRMTKAGAADAERDQPHGVVVSLTA